MYPPVALLVALLDGAVRLLICLANLASLAICCWISGVFGIPWGVKSMRRVFIPTALWVVFRRIGHANTQLRDLVMDTAWRGPNTLIIRKSGSIRARNGPKRRKRKKKKEKRKKKLLLLLGLGRAAIKLFAEKARSQASSRHPVKHILRRLIDISQIAVQKGNFRRFQKAVAICSTDATPSVIQGSHGTTSGRWCE